DDMLRLAAQGLGLATEGAAKAQLLDRIEQRLVEEARAGRRVLLIVDEAQNLPISALEELRMLSNFTSQGRALIQIFLLGQPEFRDQLAADTGLEQLRQRVIATHHLDPMEANEVEPYFVHRLAVAGWQGRPGFGPEAAAALYRHTGGVPRRVNQLATRLMLYAAMEKLETIDAGAVEAVAADMAADRPQVREERVLPLRAAKSRSEADFAVADALSREPVRDFAMVRRIEALEARLEEQEAALRRVLTLLVDWVENGQQTPGYRTNAA
ncbi:MAG: ExeA family protein, partial [Allosphingosinicella sp.]